MSLLISSILFLAGMEYLYASMSPQPYVVVAIGALAVVQLSDALLGPLRHFME